MNSLKSDYQPYIDGMGISDNEGLNDALNNLFKNLKIKLNDFMKNRTICTKNPRIFSTNHSKSFKFLNCSSLIFLGLSNNLNNLKSKNKKNFNNSDSQGDQFPFDNIGGEEWYKYFDVPEDERSLTISGKDLGKSNWEQDLAMDDLSEIVNNHQLIDKYANFKNPSLEILNNLNKTFSIRSITNTSKTYSGFSNSNFTKTIKTDFTNSNFSKTGFNSEKTLLIPNQSNSEFIAATITFLEKKKLKGLIFKLIKIKNILITPFKIFVSLKRFLSSTKQTKRILKKLLCEITGGKGGKGGKGRKGGKEISVNLNNNTTDYPLTSAELKSQLSIIVKTILLEYNIQSYNKTIEAQRAQIIHLENLVNQLRNQTEQTKIVSIFKGTRMFWLAAERAEQACRAKRRVKIALYTSAAAASLVSNIIYITAISNSWLNNNLTGILMTYAEACLFVGDHLERGGDRIP